MGLAEAIVQQAKIQQGGVLRSWRRVIAALRRRDEPSQGTPARSVPQGTMPLGKARSGATVRLREWSIDVPMARRFTELGLMPGAELTVLQNGRGPVLVRVGQSRIALGREMAARLFVTESRPADSEGAAVAALVEPGPSTAEEEA